jgi:hypothetical protein
MSSVFIPARQYRGTAGKPDGFSAIVDACLAFDGMVALQQRKGLVSLANASRRSVCEARSSQATTTPLAASGFSPERSDGGSAIEGGRGRGMNYPVAAAPG